MPELVRSSTNAIKSPKDKIDELERRKEEWKDSSTFNEKLEVFILHQVYSQLHYGEVSMENIRSVLEISRLYFESKNFLVQAREHYGKAENLFESYCSKTKNDENSDDLKFLLDLCEFGVTLLLAVVKTQKIKDRSKTFEEIDAIFNKTEVVLASLKSSFSDKELEEEEIKFCRLKFDRFVEDSKIFHQNLEKIFEKIIEFIERNPNAEHRREKINRSVRFAVYLQSFDETKEKSLEIFDEMTPLAKENLNEENSHENRQVSARLYHCHGRALLSTRDERWKDDIENCFCEALRLVKIDDEFNKRKSFDILIEFVDFHRKNEEFKNAEVLLVEALPSIENDFGEFSKELIDAKLRLGAVFLSQLEYVQAAKQFKECLETQEFVYGALDRRAIETREMLELLKKNPAVVAKLFPQLQNKSKAYFRVPHNISHLRKDNEFLYPQDSSPEKL